MQFIYVLHVLDRFASAFAQSIMPHAYPSTHIYTHRTFQMLDSVALDSVFSSEFYNSHTQACFRR